MDFLKGLRSYGGFKLRGRVSPKFQRPLAAKLRRNPKVFEVQERARGPLSSANFYAARISPAAAAGAAKNVEFFVCLSVCPSRC